MREAKNGNMPLDELTGRLAGAGSLLIISHINPDADTIGSAAALNLMFSSTGRRVVCAVADIIPDRLKFILSGCEYREAGDVDPSEFDTVISVDVASVSQMGSLSEKAGKIDYMIDHHGVGGDFAPGYVDPAASAAGEIVFDMYGILEKTHPQVKNVRGDVARALFCAISSDTGSFKYSNVTRRTHEIAGALVEIINATDGVKTDELSRRMFDTVTMSDMKRDRLAIDGLRISEDGKVAISLITAASARAAGIPEHEMTGIVEIPRRLAGVMVAASVRQMYDDETQFKISSRSNSEVDVAEIMAGFGGGGHKKAAGGGLTASSPDEAAAVVMDALVKAVRKEEKE